MAVNAFSKIKVALNSGRSTSLMVWSDSTGYYDATPRCWPFLLADRIAAQYPNYTVRVNRFNPNTVAWDAATVIQTGSAGASSPTFDIWNFAIVGVGSYYAWGSNWKFLQYPVDGLIINLGHIHSQGNLELIRGEFFTAVEQYRAEYPATPISATVQNPWRDDNTYVKMRTAWSDVSSLRAVPLIDVYSAFVASGKNPAWYTDNIHPNQTGQNQWDGVTWAHFQAADAVIPDGVTSTLVEASTKNLLPNGGFDNYSGTGAPATWSLGGPGILSASKDFSRYDPKTKYSVKLQSTGNAGWLEYRLPASTLAAVRGQQVTFSARRWIDSGSNSTLGVIILDVDGVETYSRPYNRAWDGWSWWSLSGVQIPLTANSVKLRVYHDWSANPQAKATWYDQVSFCLGLVPYAARTQSKLSNVSKPIAASVDTNDLIAQLSSTFIVKAGDSAIGTQTFQADANNTLTVVGNQLIGKRINSGLRFNGYGIAYLDAYGHEGLSDYVWGGRLVFFSDGIGGAYYKDNPATRCEVWLTARGSETTPTSKHCFGAEGWMSHGPAGKKVRIDPGATSVAFYVEAGLSYSPTLTPIVSFSNAAVPTTSTSTGSAREIRFDANYIYVCVAANSWKRAALTTF